MEDAVVRWLACMVALGLTACGSSRALVAVEQEQITLGKTEAEVVAAAGPPGLVLAQGGAETFYYPRGDQAVSVTLVGGTVAAFQDADVWPAAAHEAAEGADQPVSTGRIRLGMAEAAVRTLLGKPSGMTAADGIETWHWLTDDEVDSAVDLKAGVVVGFVDRPIAELTQNLPTHERDESTTDGRIRVGMTSAEVKALLGDPDGKSGAEGVVRHRYESDPVFGDTVHYFVGYRDDRVVEASQLNVTWEEEIKERAEEARLAAEAAERRKKVGQAMLRVLSDPRVQAALAQQVRSVQHTEVRSTEEKSLEINGTRYEGNQVTGIACSLDAPCPAGLTCHLITSTSGTCVQ
jgi:hypothetical protein